MWIRMILRSGNRARRDRNLGDGRHRRLARIPIGTACVLCLHLLSSPALAQPEKPTEEPAEDAPRSRLTLRGEYRTDTYLQNNFFLGSNRLAATGVSSERDAYWTQELHLFPRLILADNLNINVSVDIAQGIWGLDQQSPDGDRDTYTGVYGDPGSFARIHLDWAYLAYRNRPTGTRWYIGRQKFSLGRLLVLDTDATGIQVYKDFSGLGSSLGLGFAKMSESTDGLTDENPPGSVDGRDADLFYVEWERDRGRFRFNPFFAFYIDRSNSDGSTLIPNELGYLNARFQPNVTRASALGLSASGIFGSLVINLEIDQLSGVDRVSNADSGPSELLDRNNGDLRGSNLYLEAALVRSSFEIGGIFAQGSGDEDVTTGEGNLNRLLTDGHFFITEVWEDSIMPNERGLNPDGLGSPLSRGYRELENTRIIQGFLAWNLRSNLRVRGSLSLLSAVQDIPSWSDANEDGVLTPDEIGGLVSNRIGSEIDGRLDWGIEDKMVLTLRGGILFPQAGAAYLINGNQAIVEKPWEARLTLTVPIQEFSLGG